MNCCFNFAGQAKHKIQIYEQSTTTDQYGASVITWVLLRTTKAIVTPLSGGEVFKSDSLSSRVSHKFLVRYTSNLANTGVAAKCKIVMDARTFPIKLVRNLSDDLKTYGKSFQEFLADDNYIELTA